MCTRDCWLTLPNRDFSSESEARGHILISFPSTQLSDTTRDTAVQILRALTRYPDSGEGDVKGTRRTMARMCSAQGRRLPRHFPCPTRGNSHPAHSAQGRCLSLKPQLAQQRSREVNSARIRQPPSTASRPLNWCFRLFPPHRRLFSWSRSFDLSGGRGCRPDS